MKIIEALHMIVYRNRECKIRMAIEHRNLFSTRHLLPSSSSPIKRFLIKVRNNSNLTALPNLTFGFHSFCQRVKIQKFVPNKATRRASDKAFI